MLDDPKVTPTELRSELDALRPKEKEEKKGQKIPIRSKWQKFLKRAVGHFHFAGGSAKEPEFGLSESNRSELKEALTEQKNLHAETLPRCLERIANVAMPMRRHRWFWKRVEDFADEGESYQLARVPLTAESIKIALK